MRFIEQKKPSFDVNAYFMCVHEKKKPLSHIPFTLVHDIIYVSK
jgi:hypothetical protein